MRSPHFLLPLFLASIGCQRSPRVPHCEPVAGGINKCVVYGENNRVETVFVSDTVDAMPDRAYVRSLERGITGGPFIIAVNPCGDRDVIYVLQGLGEIDTTRASFDAEMLNGAYAPTRDSVRQRRDSLIANTPSECFIRVET